MHRSLKTRIMFGAATVGLTTGGLALTGIGLANADATATGGAADSPGLLSGNSVQIPINLPVNLCGNQVGVVSILDTVAGSSCSNAGGSDGSGGDGATAEGGTADSPGLLSGNLIQIPISAPLNVCGNQVDVVGLADRALGAQCSNGSGTDAGGSGATASGGAADSGGLGSGNSVQAPVTAPVNLCGNQLDIIGALDTVAGATCTNSGSTVPPRGTAPGHSCGCESHGTTETTYATPPTLAETGDDALAPLPFAGGLIGSGALLARRGARA